jgi:5-methylcytosine-specific restriction endonuclease McrA
MTEWLKERGVFDQSVQAPARINLLVQVLRGRYADKMKQVEASVKAERGAVGGVGRFIAVARMADLLGVDLTPRDGSAADKRPDEVFGAEWVAAIRRTARMNRAPGSRWAPPVYKGDVCSKDFLMSYQWRRKRMEVLTKHGARCQCCGITPKEGAVMHVDHIKPRSKFPELALEIDNLQVLCDACNHGKGNWDMTDWRPPLKTEWTVREPDELWAAMELEQCKPDWAAMGLDTLVKSVEWDTKNGYCYIVDWHIDKPSEEQWALVRDVFGRNITQFEADGIIYYRDDYMRDYARQFEEVSE